MILNRKMYVTISQIMDLVEVKNSGVHSSLFRSELYLNTKNQS